MVNDGFLFLSIYFFQIIVQIIVHLVLIINSDCGDQSTLQIVSFEKKLFL